MCVMMLDSPWTAIRLLRPSALKNSLGAGRGQDALPGTGKGLAPRRYVRQIVLASPRFSGRQGEDPERPVVRC